MRYLGKNGRIVGGHSCASRGRDMATMSEEELRQLRGSKIAMVYQEPMASLNPSMPIGRQLMEVPLYHEEVSEAEARDRALKMLAAVKLPDPGADHGRLPAPDLGRPAAARGDRHGAALQARRC